MSDVKLTRADHVATITIDRPPVNALTRVTYREITAAFDSVREDREVRAVVLTAAGTRAFSAGVDLKSLGTVDPSQESPSVALDRGAPIRALLSSIGQCPVPVICAVNGIAVGAGAGIVSMCDIVIAVEGAKLGFTEINVGLLGGMAHLSRMVGHYRARAMFFTGELIEAEELQRIGMVHRVTTASDLMPQATGMARQIAAKSPIAVRLAKESMLRTDGLPLMDAYRIEQDYTNRLLKYEDAIEARDALQRKRAPVWKWR